MKGIVEVRKEGLWVTYTLRILNGRANHGTSDFAWLKSSKRVENTAQAVDCLLCKCKDLSSYPQSPWKRTDVVALL